MLGLTSNRARTVWTRHLRPADAEAYDRFVDACPSGSYTQAREWAAALTAGRRFSVRWLLVRRGDTLVGAGLVLRPRVAGPFLLPMAKVERGPVCALADLPFVLAAMRRAARRRGIVHLEVMPYFAGDEARTAEGVLAADGYRTAHSFTSSHARTLRVDLAAPGDLALFPAKKLRYEMRNAEKSGARARRGGRADLAALARLHHDLMRTQGKSEKKQDYFDALGPLVDAGERAALFVCEHEGEIVSASLAARHGDLATWIFGASVTTRLPFSKTALTTAAAIRWAREVGCRTFDLGGIPMEGDTDDKRVAIAAFKHAFAKDPVDLVRTHARWW